MAPTWKSLLSALDRYEVIKNIEASLPPESTSTAVAIEQRAYQNSSSREEYDAACVPTPTSQPYGDISTTDSPQDEIETGIRIGSYTNCNPFADGITSEVYRSGSHALKVIVDHRNLEPHNPQREVKILQALRPPCIPLLDSFRDQQQRLVLVFPYMPLTLESLLEQGPLSLVQAKTIFTDVLHALQQIHSQNIIHRDIKPSAILLASRSGPAALSDFGTAHHPLLSRSTEPPASKILDIGTGPYRAPEVLFGDGAYGPPVDMWSLGVVISEALSDPPRPVFESRSAHEDGNQLGLILSIFKTLGTPTRDTWPEAERFKVSPFELWTVFPQRAWGEILPELNSDWRDLVAALVRYDGKRATAEQALNFKCLKADEGI